MKTKHIAILGSTGSIGTQALDIIERFPNLFKATVLTANANWEMLAKQALKFKPDQVVITNTDYFAPLSEALKGTGIKVLGGVESLALAATGKNVDMVLTALVGYSGMIPTIKAIEAGKTIALANKETLVVAGEIVTEKAARHKVKILPVDSEHSAIFQCLQGEEHKAMKKILLTASGGPFRTLSKDQLKHVTVKDALKHPNWNMGAKVTIDSASMMNKGFEMIEAKWLFNCAPKDIEILVHPQSIVHSMVEFIDGSIKAQLGRPDMHLPIQYALAYPERLPSPQDRFLNWNEITSLTFEKPDTNKFPLLSFAFKAIEKGGNMPCILNAANEIAVAAFLKEKISFTEMPRLVDDVMNKVDFIQKPTIENLITTNTLARKEAEIWIDTH